MILQCQLLHTLFHLLTECIERTIQLRITFFPGIRVLNRKQSRLFTKNIEKKDGILSPSPLQDFKAKCYLLKLIHSFFSASQTCTCNSSPICLLVLLHDNKTQKLYFSAASSPKNDSSSGSKIFWTGAFSLSN